MPAWQGGGGAPAPKMCFFFPWKVGKSRKRKRGSDGAARNCRARRGGQTCPPWVGEPGEERVLRWGLG